MQGRIEEKLGKGKVAQDGQPAAFTPEQAKVKAMLDLGSTITQSPTDLVYSQSLCIR